MKQCIIGMLLFCSAVSVNAQKKPLDESAIDNWPKIYAPAISPDGKFVTYTLSEGEGSKLIIKATDGSWERDVPGGMNPTITEDGRMVVISLPHDSLEIVRPGSKSKIEGIAGVSAYKTPKEGNGQWLAYRTTDKRLVLRDMFSGSEKSFSSVDDYAFSDLGNVLVVSEANGLLWIDLPGGSVDTICRGSGKVGYFGFDVAGNQLAFIVSRGKDHSLVYYARGMDTAVVRVDDRTPGMEKGVVIAGRPPSFSPNGNRIFFSLMPDRSAAGQGASKGVQVDVWGYEDEVLQSKQLVQMKYGQLFTAVLNKDQHAVIRINTNQDKPYVQLPDGGNGDWAMVETIEDKSEEYWRPSARPSLYLVSLDDGTRKLVKKELLAPKSLMSLSPQGGYVLWYDMGRACYYTYCVADGKIQNISGRIPVPLFDEGSDDLPQHMPIGIAGWLDNDQAVLLYDKYDIWKVDPAGTKPPENLTHGYGREHGVILRYLSLKFDLIPAIPHDGQLLLTALDLSNKDNGIFRQGLGVQEKPDRLTMGPSVYYYSFYPWPSTTANVPMKPVKAKKAEMYVVERMSAKDFPNLYATSDFIHYSPMSNEQPQKLYNWLSTELVHWGLPDGRRGEGILYKPADFDPKKKYPVIFHFYEKDANGLNFFIDPDWSHGPINIPWFVSHGYLVFDPNIHYTIGAPGESMVNSVVSAARYLATRPFVDAGKMGLQGHSFGGYEVDYLVASTNFFAAGISVSGISDPVSFYGEIRPGFGETSMQLYETGQNRMGTTPWKNPAAYLESSPILKANKVRTPLLLVNNVGDGNVPFMQGVEMFADLRRLGKPVWMLQYDGEGHTISNEENKRDFTIRMEQFFDHYLKGIPAPEWMTKGVPARLKGIDDGLKMP